MKEKTLIICMLILLVLPLVASQTYKRNEKLDLKIPFEVNGTIASVNADCNISIDYPNGDYLKENATMTNRNNGDFNITLNESEINKLGEYNWRAFCCDDLGCAAGYGNFIITESGADKISSGEGITLFISISSIIIIAMLLFIFSFKVVSFPAKLIFMGLSLVFFLVVILFSIIILGQILGGYDAIMNSYSSFFWSILFLFLIIFIFLMLCLIRNAIDLFKSRKGLM